MTTQKNIVFLSCILFVTAQAKAMNNQHDALMERASSPLSEISEQSAFFDELKSMPQRAESLLQEPPLSTKTFFELFTELSQSVNPAGFQDEKSAFLGAVSCFAGIEAKTPAIQAPAPAAIPSEPWLMDIDAAKTLFGAILGSIMQGKTPVPAIRFLATRIGAMRRISCKMLYLPAIESIELYNKMLELAGRLESREDASKQALAAFIREQLNLQPQQ